MRRMLDPKEAGGSLPSTIQFDENGNRTVGKNLTVSGDIKKPEFTSTFTKGKIPTITAKNYQLGDIVSTSLGNNNSGSGYYFNCTPCFLRKKDSSSSDTNPTLYYAYAKDGSNGCSVDGLALQGNIGMTYITIHAEGIVMKVVYLNSTAKSSNYYFPQIAQITDYSSFAKNVIHNPDRFISITGISNSIIK